MLRTVTFSDAAVGEALAKDFVCAWKNRKAGFHNCDPSAERRIFELTADAFPTRNIVTLFLTPDLQVVHYVAGYFSPAIFLEQVEFAKAARESMFDEAFRPRAGAREALESLHAESAGRSSRAGDPQVPATPDSGEFCYDGSDHKHVDACLWTIRSVWQYLAIVHDDLDGTPLKEEQVQVAWNNMGNNRRRYWSGLSREEREVAAEPGERRVLEGVPLLSELEGKYLYGNPFTEE